VQTLHLEPRRCLYVGDNPTHDIDPCNQEGWYTVRMRRSGRHAEEVGATTATWEIRSFFELQTILREQFGVR
jgi:FMN phosphatase YigB (HAD superfamily)